MLKNLYLRYMLPASHTVPGRLIEVSWCARRLSALFEILHPHPAPWPKIAWVQSKFQILPGRYCQISGRAFPLPCFEFDLLPYSGNLNTTLIHVHEILVVKESTCFTNDIQKF